MNVELQNERIWLQSHVMKLKAKINERSNDILRGKATQEVDNNSSTSCSCQIHIKSNNPTEKLMNNLQEKVSSFILQQIEFQFDKMVESFNINGDQSSSFNVSTNNYSHQENRTNNAPKTYNV